MPDVSRNDAPPENPQYPGGAPPDRERQLMPDEPPLLPGMPQGSNLPANDFYADRRWNRPAEAIGRGLGSAVAGVRRVPRSVDQAKSRIRVVRGKARANASAAAFELMDSVAQRASYIRQTAGEKVAQMADQANDRASDLSNLASERWDVLRDRAAVRLEGAREFTEARIVEWRRDLDEWQQKDPVKALMTIAGAAFVAGVVIRVWRSSRD